MAKEFRKYLMTFYDDSIIDIENDEEYQCEKEHIILSDFIKMPKKDIIPYENGWDSLEVTLYNYNGHYLLFDYNHGSCGGCGSSISNMIFKKIKENGLEQTIENQKKFARDIVEDLIDDMLFFESESDALKHIEKNYQNGRKIFDDEE